MSFYDDIRDFVAQLILPTRFYGFYEYRITSVGVRVVGQPNTERLTLQIVTKLDGLEDEIQLDKAHGSPALNEECALGSLVLVGFVGGDPGRPYVGHYWRSLPVRARLDASGGILVGASLTEGSRIVLGSGSTRPVALAPAVVSAFQAVETYSSAVTTFASAAAALPGMSASAAALVTAQVTLLAALSPLLGSAPAGLASVRTYSE